MSSTVLITTANNPPPGVPFLKMTNPATRQIIAKAAVFFWAAHGAGKIVIADATGGMLLNEQEERLLGRMGVETEQIAYSQDDALIRLKGKGYGEGMLLKFSLEKSELLKKETNFFKCTGKVYCRNFRQIMEMIRNNGIKAVFWRHLDGGVAEKHWVDTRFFFASRQFFEENLVPAFLQSDDSRAAAEHVVFQMLNGKLPRGRSLRPLLSGFAGGTGEQYFDASLGVLDLKYPCWMELR